jgi:hypothetical protein
MATPLLQGIERIEAALKKVLHGDANPASEIHNELTQKAEACRQLAAEAEDEWRFGLSALNIGN